MKCKILLIIVTRR